MRFDVAVLCQVSCPCVRARVVGPVVPCGYRPWFRLYVPVLGEVPLPGPSVALADVREEQHPCVFRLVPGPKGCWPSLARCEGSPARPAQVVKLGLRPRRAQNAARRLNPEPVDAPGFALWSPPLG
eukprot:2606904-Alexandrium_andersonii.AAC.1